MNKALLHPEVQEFIRENCTADLSTVIFKGSPFPDISIQELAVQINGLNKARTKIPTWFKNRNIIYPPNINLEQTSSETTAKYKASLAEGNNLIDLTGGLGIDDYFFAKNFKEVTHCEINPELSEIATHNFRALKAENIRTVQGDGIEILKNSAEYFDWIYIDPSRRDEAGGKVFHLDQCTPDVSKNLELFFQRSDNILIKTSPLLDLKQGITELDKVKEIHIIAVDHEVKELLWILKKKFKGEVRVKTLHFQKKETQEFEAGICGSQKDVPVSLPRSFIYEPNPAIMKSGMFAELAIQTGTAKLHPNSHLYTSEELLHFPGRRFKLHQTLAYKRKALKKSLKLKKANITTRNFPGSVASLRKELKIEDGGTDYLFFTTNVNEEKVVLVCSKIP